MATFQLFNEVEDLNRHAVRQDSRQLESFRCEDFSSMRDELSAVITKDQPISLRFVPLVSKVSRDKADHYRLRPHRRWKGVSEMASAELDDIYQRSKLDRALLTAARKCVGQRMIVLTCDPAGPGQVRVQSWIPAELEIAWADPLETDIRKASEVAIRVPVSVDGYTLIMGRRVYTQSEAYTEAPGGKRVGIFREDLSNPFGYVPLVSVAAEDRRAGHPFPPLAYSLLACQIGLNIALSDIEAICRDQCYARQVLSGPGAQAAARSMTSGPRDVLVFDGDEPLDFKVLNSRPEIGAYLSAASKTLELLALYQSVSPAGLVGSTGITGAAKELEALDLVADRADQESLWEDAERDLADLVVDVLSAAGSIVGLGRPSLSVGWRRVEPRGNDLQSRQSSALDFAMGLDSALELIQRTQGLDRDEAREVFEERLRRFDEMRARGMFGGLVPGLDSISGAVGADEPEAVTP